MLGGYSGGIAVNGIHPCDRVCDGKPMLCEYELSAEWYLTLSKVGNVLIVAYTCIL